MTSGAGGGPPSSTGSWRQTLLSQESTVEGSPSSHCADVVQQPGTASCVQALAAQVSVVQGFASSQSASVTQPQVRPSWPIPSMLE